MSACRRATDTRIMPRLERPADYIRPRASMPDGAPAATGCLYRIVREEDVNVDLGDEFVPAIPPPAVRRRQARRRPSRRRRRAARLRRSDPPAAVRQAPGRAPEPAERRRRLLPDDQPSERRSTIQSRAGSSAWSPTTSTSNATRSRSGTARRAPIADIPIGIRDYNWRLITTTKTDTNGAYEVLLPSTETFNCPIPQGLCPGMYGVVVNDPGDKAHPNPNYNPNHLTATLAWDVWPGQTTQLDTPLDPISGTGCELAARPCPSCSRSPSPYVGANTTADARRITIQGRLRSAPHGPVSADDSRAAVAQPARRHPDDRQRRDRELDRSPDRDQRPDDGRRVPAPARSSSRSRRPAGNDDQQRAHAARLRRRATDRRSSTCTAPTAQPARDPGRDRRGGAGGALARPAAGRLQRERHRCTSRSSSRASAPAASSAAPRSAGRDPDDPRFNVPGTVDRRPLLRRQRGRPGAPKLRRRLTLRRQPGRCRAAPTSPSSPSNVAVPARLRTPAIDGIGITTGHGGGAGGIQVNARAPAADHQQHARGQRRRGAGAIGLGQPPTSRDNQNDNVRIRHNRVLGNGGLTQAGGIGIYDGAERNYESPTTSSARTSRNEYGGGISHWGLQPGGTDPRQPDLLQRRVRLRRRHRDRPRSFRSRPGPHRPARAGRAASTSTRNLIQRNYSSDDGGGIFVLDAHTDRVDIVNNMIVDNGATDIGGAITLDDASNVTIVNNTIANNVSTASAEDSDGTPHRRGSRPRRTATASRRPLTGPNRPTSRPRALFNNIFWDNEAFTLDGPRCRPASSRRASSTSRSSGRPVPRTFTPRYSLLTVPHGAPATQGNIVGQDPLFVNPFTLELVGVRLTARPAPAAVTIVGQDPPVGLPGRLPPPGHLARDRRGAPFSNFPFPPVATSPTPEPSILAPSRRLRRPGAPAEQRPDPVRHRGRRGPRTMSATRRSSCRQPGSARPGSRRRAASSPPARSPVPRARPPTRSGWWPPTATSPCPTPGVRRARSTSSASRRCRSVDSVSSLITTYKGKAQTPAPILAFEAERRRQVKLTNVGLVARPDLADAHTIHWHGFRTRRGALRRHARDVDRGPHPAPVPLLLPPARPRHLHVPLPLRGRRARPDGHDRDRLRAPGRHDGPKVRLQRRVDRVRPRVRAAAQRDLVRFPTTTCAPSRSPCGPTTGRSTGSSTAAVRILRHRRSCLKDDPARLRPDASRSPR